MECLRRRRWLIADLQYLSSRSFDPSLRSLSMRLFLKRTSIELHGLTRRCTLAFPSHHSVMPAAVLLPRHSHSEVRNVNTKKQYSYVLGRSASNQERKVPALIPFRQQAVQLAGLRRPATRHRTHRLSARVTSRPSLLETASRTANRR